MRDELRTSQLVAGNPSLTAGELAPLADEAGHLLRRTRSRCAVSVPLSMSPNFSFTPFLLLGARNDPRATWFDRCCDDTREFASAGKSDAHAALAERPNAGEDTLPNILSHVPAILATQ